MGYTFFRIILIMYICMRVLLKVLGSLRINLTCIVLDLPVRFVSTFWGGNSFLSDSVCLCSIVPYRLLNYGMICFCTLYRPLRCLFSNHLLKPISSPWPLTPSKMSTLFTWSFCYFDCFLLHGYYFYSCSMCFKLFLYFICNFSPHVSCYVLYLWCLILLYIEAYHSSLVVLNK